MKLAIVSDIHGNLAALEAVIADLESQAPDVVIHGGDLVTIGPRPAECLDRVRELGWPGVVGNTDQALWRIPDSLPEMVVRTFHAMAPVTAGLLGAERIDWLRTLPMEWRQGDEVAVVHAVPGNTWMVVAPDAGDDELRATYGPLGAQVAVYGHIHRPYVRRLEGLTVANTGSVGIPWDGDNRSSYLLVEEGVPTIRRVAYDVERQVADVQASGYPVSDWLIQQARTAAGGFPRLNP